MDLGEWLRNLGLEEYEAAFRDNKVDERVLPNLTQEDLSTASRGRAYERAIKLQAANGCRIDAVGAHNIDQRFTISEPLDGRLTLTQAADRSLAREAFLPAIIPTQKNIALKTSIKS